MKVKLEDITDAMEMLDEYSEAFINERTGELEWVSDMVMSRAEIEEIYDRLDEDGFFRLPTQYDINEYGIMEDFIFSLPHGRVRDELSDAIQDRDAFRRFKDSIINLGVDDEWYSFRDTALRRIAEDWCIDNQLEYES